MHVKRGQRQSPVADLQDSENSFVVEAGKKAKQEFSGSFPSLPAEMDSSGHASRGALPWSSPVAADQAEQDPAVASVGGVVASDVLKPSVESVSRFVCLHEACLCYAYHYLIL